MDFIVDKLLDVVFIALDATFKFLSLVIRVSTFALFALLLLAVVF